MRKTSIIIVFLLLINLFSVLPVFAWGNNLVSLDKTLQSLKVEDTVTLTATISPANDNSLKWSTVDVDGSNVIQLDKTKGNPVTVTALNVGTAVVTVRHGNRSATCKIIVGPTSPQSPGNAGLLVDVNADQSEITKPPDGPANDDLNITLTPTGSAPTSNRPPVDIVFVFDKSGSMGHEVGDSGLSKIDIAKNALDNAVDFFSNAKNANSDDKLALVAFDSGVYSKTSLTTKANNGFIKLQNTVNSLFAYGGTNYTDALDEAINIFNSTPSSLSRKYVIFLTDGMPTISVKNEQVNQVLKSGYFDWYGTFHGDYSKTFNLQTDLHYDSNYNPYPNKYIVDNGQIYYFPNMTFQSIENSIMDQGKEKAAELAQMNIKLYSIGLGDLLPNNDMSSWTNQDAINYMANYLNFDYLDALSEITGATVQQALANDTGSLNNIYQSLIQQINNQTISGIQLKVKLPANVSVPTDNNIRMENGYAVLNMPDISFPTDGTTPNPINNILPLLFSETGIYTFDDIKLYYTDLNGDPKTMNIQPVTINVTSNFVPVTGVKVDPANLHLSPNATYQLNASVMPSNATNQNVVWSSSNTDAATVDSRGVVTAHNVGNATITASVDNGNGDIKSGQCSVIVGSSNADLKSLTVSVGTLTPGFSSDNTDYMVNVPYDVNTEVLTATASDSTATLKIKDSPTVLGHASSTISLNVGQNIVQILVTAQDGISTKTYTVMVTRQDYPAPDFSLSQSGIIGNYAMVKIHPDSVTIRDDTEWYKYELVNTNGDRNWVKFHTGPFPGDGEGLTGITLDTTVDSSNNVIVSPQTVKIKADTGDKENIALLKIVPVTVNNPIEITEGGVNSASGNRATKVTIKYNLPVPAGVEVEFLDDTPDFIVKNQNGVLVMSGRLPNSKPDYGINKVSTPVIKFLKSSSGYSQKFFVQGELNLILKTTLGESLPLTFYQVLDVTVLSNEMQQ
jgi:uncharacterized protein YjdB